jgi:hypothetical protein
MKVKVGRIYSILGENEKFMQNFGWKAQSEGTVGRTRSRLEVMLKEIE